MDLQGTVFRIGEIEEKGASGFKVAKVILDRKTSHEGQDYPNFTEITFQGKKTELLEERNIGIGDFVKVSGDIKGRFFNNAEGKECHAQEFSVWGLEVVRKNIVETPNNTPASTTNDLA